MTVPGVCVAEAVVAISSVPFQATRPGTYQLAKDLTIESLTGAAIVVQTDNVVVDLGGHSLINQGDASTNAVGILAVNRHGITIRNGTISGFYFGIDIRRATEDLQYSKQHQVQDVTVTSNWYFGIRIEGESSVIQQCQVLDTGGSTRPNHTIPIGIRMVGKNNTLRDSCIRNLHLQHHSDGRGEIIGVHFDDALGSEMVNNTISEIHNESDARLPADDRKERRFGIWVNGGPNRDTYLRVTNNKISGFTVPLVFSPGSDGTAVGNIFDTSDKDPIRGKPTGKLDGNATENTKTLFECR